MENFSYNLVDERWIPCAGLDGKHLSLGVNELLMRAHEIRSLAHHSPLTEAALLRVLLAVVHRAVDGPRNGPEWKRLYEKKQFDSRITAYLEKWRHRLDLFSEEAPFYQTPGLITLDGDESPSPQLISTIMLERACGNTKTLFDHSAEDTPVRASPAEAAHALITAQMFSLGGLNRKMTNLFGYQQSFLHGVMVSGIFIALTGESLFDTLMLNLLVYGDNEPIPNTAADCPVWERKDRGDTKAVTPKGYLDFLTCKCRHILLVPESDGKGVFVEKIHLAQGEAFGREVVNPGFYSKKKKDGSFYHPQLDINRLVWRDSAALFAFDESGDRRPMAFRQAGDMRGFVSMPSKYVCTAYALANDQANPLAWRRERLSVPLSLLSNKDVVDNLKTAMSLSENAAFAVGDAARVFMSEYLPANSKDVKDKADGSGAVQAYWDGLEGHFQSFLSGLDDPEKALNVWKNDITDTAREALERALYGKYRGSAKTYRAWASAWARLNERLAGLREERG